MTRLPRSSSIALTLAALLIASTALAQVSENGTPAVRLELGGTGGASAGMQMAQGLTDAFRLGLQLGGLRNIQGDPGTSFKWVLGGNIGVGVAPRVLAVGEVLVNRIAHPRFTGTVLGQSVGIGAAITLSEYTGGLQYLFATGTTAPYVGGGLGFVRLSAAVESSALPGDFSNSESNVTWNVGGGMRFHGGSSWGLRPDVRIVRVPDETYLRATVSVFYQVR